MKALTRRAALAGATAAVVVAGVPGGVADDPIWAVLARAQSLQDQITAAPNNPETAALETTVCDAEVEIFETQATTFDGLLAKARYARWIVAPGDPQYRLDGDNLVLSLVRDLERLAVDFERQIGGMRP